MRLNEIKFKFDYPLVGRDVLDEIFEKVGRLLDIQLDENLNPYRMENGPRYSYKEVYRENEERELDEFFSHTFRDIIDRPLYRFLILKTDAKLIVSAVIHPFLFDYTSLNKIYELFNASPNLEKTDEYVNTKYLYESMLADDDEAGILLECISPDGPGNAEIDLKIDDDSLKSFLNENNISKNVLFTSAFAYTLSRFTGSDKVLFNLSKNDSTSTLMLFDCENRDIASFMEYMSGLIYDLMRYDDYKSDISSDISFQFVSDLGNESPDIGDFNVRVIQKENVYTLIANYCDKYSHDFSEGFIKTCALILRQMLDVDLLSDIEYITPDDIELLESFNQIDYPLAYEDILDAFNDNLSKYPNAKLVSMNKQDYTYSESTYIADRITDKLRNLGVESGDYVAFLTERSPSYMFSILAILSMGCVYIPLDDKHPDERIRYMIEDTESKIMIISDETLERAKNLTDNVPLLNISDILRDEIGNLDKLPVVYKDLACILYTSGTTGQPKGVKITRKSINNISQYYKETYSISSDDIYGLYASIGFDVANFAIFSSLYVGACVTIIPDEIKLDMSRLNEYYVRQNVTHTVMTTQVAKLFIENTDTTSLEVLLTGGEKMGDYEGPSEYTLVDVYGPTESFMFTNSVITSNKIHPTSVGKFNYNMKSYILDNEQRRVPFGAVGELYLAGYQVAEGYLDFDEDKRAFLDNPFCTDEDYNRLYRTGDIVRYLPDGSLGIVGRRDKQVKIRGNRVELSEVDAIIRDLDYIKDLTVQTVKNNNNNELVAYIVSSNDWDDERLREDICNHVAKNKPNYMVPSFVVRMESIPLTVNGKVDHRNLPEVDVESLQSEYVYPTNETEEKVVEAFKKIFKHERIGIHDDFIRLGGDSLAAIRLLSHLKSYHITSADILSLRTPQAIAENIKKESFNLDIYSLNSGCPLNEPQLNVYLDIKAHGKQDAYIIPLYMEISNECDIMDALNRVLDAHPILRMCVSEEMEVPYLVNGTDPEIIIKSQSNKDFILNFLTKEFNLQDSLSRFLAIEDGNKYKLFAVFHHLIFDGLSLGVFKKDLEDIIAGKFLEVDDSFLKVSAFTSRIKDCDEYLSAGRFYESMLAESNESGILLDSVLTDGPGIERIELNLNNELLKSFLNKSKVSENVLFTSAFAYTLSRFVGSDKVQFNIVENGRDRFNINDSIGMFVNTLPLLVECENTEISSFLDYMSTLIYDVIRYNYYPFRLLANEYDIDSNIIFQYLPDWINEDLLVTNDEYDLIEGMNDFINDFTVEVIQNDKNYDLSIIYSDKYSKEFIERFAKTYKLILHEMIDVEELSDIDYTDDNEIKLVDSFNDTQHSLAFDDILDAFNANLAKNPNSELVCMKEKSYTYGQGAYIADRIAKKLSDFNIKPNDCVGFLTERCEHYMFSILAIMSIGGVYVPLDDKFPKERIRFMFEDSNSRALIVSDETYEESKNLTDNIINISDIIKEGFGSLNHLPVTYNDLACILYTSGTTGLPKGVKVTRQSVLNTSNAYVDRYEMKNNDVYGLYVAIGFDVASLGFGATIFAGASMAIVPEDIKLDMFNLNEYFIAHNVTYSAITAQVAKLFMDNIKKTSLKVLSVGGEKLGNIGSPDYMLIDEYGSTEAFGFVSSIDNNEKIDPSSVGRLNYNTKAYVLDDELRRVPFGAVGELCLTGRQIAEGYLNREKETNKSFLNNPFDDYDTLYRTGDLVRLLPDGSLGIVGRRDGQVKIRGNRVELSEVESTIRNIDFVEDVTVQTTRHASNNELVAFVVISKEIDDLKGAVCDYVSQNKPEYMVPSYVMKLDEIPLTANGKVDKNALPEIDLSDLREEYVAATNETEKSIVAAFEEVLDQENISLTDDFTHLGGDSITAIRVVSFLQKDNINISARDILTYKTPYLISKNVEKAIEVSYNSIEGELNLLPIQSFFVDEINLDSFTQEFIVKSAQNLDLDLLQEAFDELSNVHDMLRAIYKRKNNSVVQEIHPIGTRVCEINEFAIDNNFNENIKDILLKSNLSIDMENKLIDISLVRHDGECYVIFVIHHMIVDGVSWTILLDDLTYIYTQMLSGEKINLKRPYTYKDWVDNVKELVEEIPQDERQHWIETNNMLDDSQIKGNPKVFNFSLKADFNIANLLMLSEEEYLALAIARAYKKTYDEDIIFNRESHGRDESLADVSRTVGWFTNQYPLPIKVSNDNDHISLVQDICSIKKIFKSISNLGLNYASLIYTTGDLEFKNCPVTFNFLSSEFVFKNRLFESVDIYFDLESELNSNKFGSDTYGINLNISHVGDSYVLNGVYADNTYIGAGFNEFIDNIEKELDFIAAHQFNDTIICPLSDSQLGVYLDEKVHDKGTAYSTYGTVECRLDKSVDEIRDAIELFIDKHPILKGRVLDGDENTLLACDSYPTIELTDTKDYSKLIKQFDLNKSLARFYIIHNDESKEIFYDIHHMINDATSCMIIEQDLTNALNGKLDITKDYGFVRESNNSFEAKFGEEYKKAKEFYADMFAELDEAEYMMEDVDGSSGTVSIPIHGIRSDVESFAHDLGVTVGNLLNAVFAYTYSRFTGSRKVYYNFTEHGRHEEYCQNALGMFVRTIPVIVDCRNDSVENYLTKVCDLILNSMSNSVYPFSLLANEYNLNNNVTFEYNYDLNDVSDIADEITFSKDVDRVSEFLCVANDLEDGYVIRVSHLDKYSRDTVLRFLKAFRQILIQILEKENLKDIDYIEKDDLKLLDRYNDTEHQLAYDDILDAFNVNLARNPNNELVCMEGRSYTYGEGAFIAERLSKKLLDMGVKPDDCVGFLTERSEYYMFAVLGIMSIGGVYVPMDDAHPDERLDFILKDTQSKVLIVSDKTRKRAKHFTKNILNISDIVNGELDSKDSLPIIYNDLACILYTSGTTGLPKGVRITRKSILNVSSFYVDQYGLGEGDVYGLFATIGFDAANFAINCVYYAGATLNIVAEDIRLDMPELNRHFIENNVTHSFITTQVGKLFAHSIDDTSLEVLMVGGEKLGEFESPKDYKFIDIYGPTEAFTFISQIDNLDKIDSSSLGHINYNLKAYILDEESRRVPVGAIGELYLAGIQIANGYLNRSEETRNAFLENPFDDCYDVLYRTGDMVRLLPDGSLAIVGRRDSQVKIRGNRVELTEVESSIRDIDIVEDVTVQTIKNGLNNELVAYVVSSKDRDDLRDIVRRHVLRNKPEYMVPSFVIKVDMIPLNVNGKVDKRSLPEVDLTNLQVEYVSPTNEVEMKIVDAFSRVFNQKLIGLNDDFSILGGDSIMAIRIISMLQKNGINVTARDILTYKTPYLIAQNVRIADDIVYDAVEGEVDLLSIQKYFFDYVDYDRFTQEFILKANVDLDLEILQNAFDKLCNVHDMLRAKYRRDGDSIVQEILPTDTRVCEISEYYIDDNFNDSVIDIFLKSLRSLSMKDHLIDISLIHYKDECYILFVIHHLIVDGVSWSIILDDLTYIYFQLVYDGEINLVRPYPYRNWVEDVKKLVYNISDEEKQHWTNINDMLDDTKIKGKSNLFAFNIDATFDADNLLMLSEEEFLALAIARAYKKTYNKDIIFNKESHGRDDTLANVSRTVGWFTSQYPIPVKVGQGHDQISLIKDIYAIKRAFGNVDNLGLNYASLVYTTGDLEFKHCPVTFNFLSTEFTYKNKIFESVNTYLSAEGRITSHEIDNISYGISINVSNTNESYIINGDYAMDTYISDGFDEFILNIKKELNFISENQFSDTIICPLSESQLGIYLDEKVHDKGTAYSTSAVMECPKDKSLDEIMDAIERFIDKHPVLKGRVLEDENNTLLVCDSYPKIELTETSDYSSLIEPFDLDKSLTRFYINDKSNEIFYNIHHIITDATTLTIINRELIQALNGDLDEDIDLAFVYNSRNSFESKFTNDYKKARKFFTDMFSEIDEAGHLPADVDGSCGTVSLPIRGIRSKVELFAHDNSITVGNLFNAVFAYAYSRFAGSNKVYFNFTEHGRHESYSKDAVGMFVRTIPLMVDCTNSSVKEYLHHVSYDVLKAMEHSDYPFRLLASQFDLVNDVAFEYNFDLNDVSHIGNEIILSDDIDAISEFLCVVNDLDDGYVVSVSYLDKYSTDTVVRFVNVFREILLHIMDKENLSDIDYISEGDAKLLESYNNTEHTLDYDDLLDAFNDHLQRWPENKLVSMNDNDYSYGEGAYIANQIAERLLELGVKPNDCVSFLTERSEHYMFVFLAILSIGAVCVPLDDAYPDERIKFIFNDTSSKVLIVTDETYERSKKLSNNLLNISDIINEGIGSLNHLPVFYNNLACILYTSGTTGLPKGVKVTRKAILNAANVYADTRGMTNGDVYGLFSSIGFDIGLIGLSATVFTGASMAVVPKDIKLDIFALNEYFISHGVTYSAITTQVAKMFMENITDTPLKLLSAGGEKLGDVESPNFVLIDEYGPTEAFAFISSINNNDKIDPSSVGKINYNSKAYVLDEELRPVPIGAIGELYLAGYQIAEGYLNRDDETQKSFLNNPFNDDEDYSTLYRTGDMVRFLNDATLSIIGRRDDQVKIRGNRVELSEVESTIRNLDIVEDITVQTIRHANNNELVAYVVPNEDVDNLKELICSHVSRLKPEYMIPSYVIRMDEIPLNVNGKVDKSQLPEVDIRFLHTEYVGPRNETERKIIDAFNVAFNQKDIGLNDDFAQLGGDSISAIRINALLQKDNVNVTARDILTYKTPYIIAQNVRKSEETTYDAVEGEVELLPIQSYFFNQINLDNFTQEFILKANADLDLEIFQKSFDELSDIHDMLRAVYKTQDESVIQEIRPTGTRVCEINEYDIEGDFNESIRDILIKSHLSIDMENKLVDVSIVHYHDAHYVIFIIHHLIIDGVSWSILLDDLTYIYSQLVLGGQINLIRPYPYKNWINDVRKLAKDIDEDERHHWTEINKRLDDSRIKGDTNVFAFNVDAPYDIDNLLMLSEEEYLALAIARAYKMTYGEEIIFNRETHGRDESLADVSRSIGWFTSQYPVHVNVGNSHDRISLMQDICTIKEAFNNVDNSGLNYLSLIYTLRELEFKHCPVTFNFLSTEFSYKNKLFKSINSYLDSEGDVHTDQFNSQSFGITLNVSRLEDSYIISGDYASNTYIGDKFDEFGKNIREELKFINETQFDDSIICPLSESQLGIYLDEKVQNKGIAYSTRGIFEVPKDKSYDEIKNAIDAVINRHPILKARIFDNEGNPLLICDTLPSIETTEKDYLDITRPFDLNESLARFYIIDDDESKKIFYELHHIISDGTTISIINQEFTEAFDGKMDGNIDFGFVYASRDSFNSKFSRDYVSAMEFFHNLFADIDNIQYLLEDVNRSSGTVSLPILGIKSQVEAFTQDIGITVGSFMNAVFAYAYSRFTGNDRVYFNFNENGRHESYSQYAVGMFVRTIPLMVDCASTSVEDYLTGVSDLILQSMSNSTYPFRLLAHEFNLKNNVAFEYNHSLSYVSDIGNEMTFSDNPDHVSELLCYVNDLQDGYVVSLGHSDKYSNDTASRFLKAFEAILVQILEKENLSDISYIDDEDIKLLNNYNHTEHSLVYDDVFDAFVDNLTKCLNDDLVLDENASFTYGEGAYLINKIQEILNEHKIGVNDKVSVFVDRNHWVLFANMAVLSIGATYVPIDENNPDNRIRYMIEKSKSKAIITTDTFKKRTAEITNDLDVDIINVSQLDGECGVSEGVDYVNPCKNDVACILFTSGTTGNPKAVQVARHSIANMVSFYAHNSEFTSEDVYGVFASVGFDVSLQHYAAILMGGSVTWVPNDIRLNIKMLNDYFTRLGVTHTILTTQISKLFVENIRDTSIRNLCAVGEKLGAITPPKDYEFVDVYGPTEATSSMTSINVRDKINASSVGNPDWNTKIYVLDKEQRRVPFGAVGELYISGIQVSKGYLDNPEANRNAFFDNTFDGNVNDYEKMYKTGDVVKLLPDGSVGFIGRNDSQVKIRGNRVELTEIESAIHDLDYIDDVTVQTIEHNGNKELIAYVVCQREDVKDDVCEFVRQHKPDYMVPTFVIRLDRIPLNVNGKVDKRALPDPDLKSMHVEYVGPRNETERKIVEAFEKVFDSERIGIHDDFVRLGGDSLTAIRINALLPEIDVMTILAEKTPYSIAKNLTKNKEYSFKLVKKGIENQNMFMLPPIGGMSFVFMKLIDEIGFNGNIYLINDFKYDLTLDEMGRADDCNLTLNHYYDAIKDLFQDGDIIVGYSLGCIYASLIAEKLEKTKTIAECILIDGTLKFKNLVQKSREDMINDLIIEERETYNYIADNYPADFKDKFLEISIINSNWSFNTPRINSHITYLATSNRFKEDLINISSNYEFVHIDSTHEEIIARDCDKIAKYFNP